MDDPQKQKQMDIRKFNYTYDGSEQTGRRRNSMRQSYEEVGETKKKHKWLKRFIVLLLLIAIGAGVFFAVSYFYVKEIVRLKGEETGRVNILVSGVDKAAKLSDTLMLISIKTDVATEETKEEEQNYKLAMISVPRDLYVEVEPFGYNKINAAYSLGENPSNNVKGGGPGLIKRTVEKTFDVDVHYQASVDFEAFKEIVDAVGGVTIDVPKDIYDPYYPSDSGGQQTVQFSAGKQKMDGETALKYARSRQTTSDFDRAARQQQVMLAVKDKMLNPEFSLDQAKILGLQNTLAKHIETDMKTTEMLRLVEIGRNLKDKNITRHVLTNEEDNLLYDSGLAGSTLSPKLGVSDFSDIQDFVKNIFSQSENTLPQTHKKD